MKPFPTLHPGSEDAVVEKRFPDLIRQSSVNASLAVERRRVASRAVLNQVVHNVQVAAQARVVPVSEQEPNLVLISFQTVKHCDQMDNTK